MVEDKIIELGSIFALNVCAYVVMSNHYHVVLHIDQATAEAWSERGYRDTHPKIDKAIDQAMMKFQIMDQVLFIG